MSDKLIPIAAAGLGLWWLMGRNQAAPAPAGSPAPTGENIFTGAAPELLVDVPARAEAYSSDLHGLLEQRGFTTIKSYVTPDSHTEEIVDTDVTRKRNLVAENQAMTDLFHQFMWATNAILVYDNWNPQAPTIEEYDQMYQTLREWILTL